MLSVTLYFYAAVLIGRIMDLARPSICLSVCLLVRLSRTERGIEKLKLV